MIVEIDDAGTGSPVGGVVIGCRRGERFAYRVIPPQQFEKRGVYSNEIQKIVAEIVNELLNDVGFNREEDRVLICSSRIFNEARKLLDAMDISWSIGRIEGIAQELVEAAFDFHLVSIGVPRLLVKRLTSYSHYVIELLKWVTLNRDERSKYVKKSFNIWKKVWSKAELRIDSFVDRKRGYCIICGGDIRPGEKSVIIKFITPRKEYTALAHHECVRDLL